MLPRRHLVLRIIVNFSGHLCSAYRPRVAREVMSTSSRGLLSAPHLSPSERRQTQVIQHGVVAVYTDHRREFRAVLQTPIPKRREDIVQWGCHIELGLSPRRTREQPAMYLRTFAARGAPAKHTGQRRPMSIARRGEGEGKSRVIMRVNGFYSIFCPHSQGLSPHRKRWLGKSTGATFTACSPWKTIQFRHWYISHIIKALSHRSSPDAEAQAVQCPQKVRTSPAYSSGVQTPFYKPYHTPPPIKLIRWKTLAHRGSMQPPTPPPPHPLVEDQETYLLLGCSSPGDFIPDFFISSLENDLLLVGVSRANVTPD